MSVWNSTGLLVLPVLPQEKMDSTEVLEHVFGGHTEMLVPESNAVDGRPSGQRKQDSPRRVSRTGVGWDKDFQDRTRLMTKLKAECGFGPLSYNQNHVTIAVDI